MFFHEMPQSVGTLPVNVLPEQSGLEPKASSGVTIDPHATIAEILEILKGYHAGNDMVVESNSTVASGSSIEYASPTYQMVPDNGYEYADYSGDYGFWDNGGGIDWGGSNVYSDGPAPSAVDAPKSVLLYTSIAKTDGSGTTVSVDFNYITSDGKNGDQTVTQNLRNVTHDILAATPGVESVDVSATTNGVHDTHSDH